MNQSREYEECEGGHQICTFRDTSTWSITAAGLLWRSTWSCRRECMSRFTCYSKTFWDKAQNQNATYKSVTGISRGISLTLSLWRLSRKATLPVGNISWGPCKHTLSRHACENQPALLVQHRGKMASLTEERTGKLAAEAAPLLPWLQGWVTELGLPRLTAQHHVRPPLGRSLLPASAPVDTLSLWRMRGSQEQIISCTQF